MTGERWTQEDTHVLIDDLRAAFPEQLKGVPFQRFSFYAIFDGHGGPRVSALLQEWLIKDFLAQRELFGRQDVNFHSVLETSFRRADQAICSYCTRMGFYDGSTGVVALVVDSTVYVANLGDSEGVLARHTVNGHWEAIEMTEYHNASSPEEAQMVRDRGGFVENDRVQGSLALSRAFGDIDFKSPWNGAPRSWVSADPHITSYPLSPEIKGLVLACDGLWDCVSHTDSVWHIRRACRDNRDPFSTANELLRDALGLKSNDNISVIVVFFHF